MVQDVSFRAPLCAARYLGLYLSNLVDVGFLRYTLQHLIQVEPAYPLTVTRNTTYSRL